MLCFRMDIVLMLYAYVASVNQALLFIPSFPTIKNKKSLESQFRFVCPHFGSINSNCALRYLQSTTRGKLKAASQSKRDLSKRGLSKR